MFDSGEHELELEGVYFDNITSGFTLGSLDNFIVPTVSCCIILGQLDP